MNISHSDCAGCESRVREIVETAPDAYLPNQSANPLNPAAHGQTMAEIVAELGRPADHLVCAVRTTGTFTDCARYIREHQLNTSVIAVDAPPAHWLPPGLGLPGRGQEI
jgi:N-(2-amino-2-carboxyethyl)-L-glutamate synthase